MNPYLAFGIITGYFLVLITVSYFTSKNADTQTFFTANRQSPWYVVAFGMIGATLSGISFISVPGEVGNSQFAYFQVVMGYMLGYLVIANILMPLYYRLNLITIYSYLHQRFGMTSYRTGSFFFLLSRTIGASFRLFLVAGVLQIAFFNQWNVPFAVSVFVTIVLIWIYTFKGGIKTIVWTDSLQTLMMLLAVGVTIVVIAKDLNFSWMEIPAVVADTDYSKIFVWDWKTGNNFFKQFFSGAFITIVMTGLDQDMMQKNLTCKNIGEAKKNMYWFSGILIIANLLFLSLGALLYLYASQKGIQIPEKSDWLFPTLAVHHFNILTGVLFLLGITAAAYSSADSALTSLTTSFCVDFLEFDKREEKEKKKIRQMVHIGFSILLFIVIIIFRELNNDSLINTLFRAAGYTYGPLLGLFAFGLFTKLHVKDKYVIWICLSSPVLSYLVNTQSKAWFGFEFGFTILMVNGLLTFLGLWIISLKSRQE